MTKSKVASKMPFDFVHSSIHLSRLSLPAFPQDITISPLSSTQSLVHHMLSRWSR